MPKFNMFEPLVCDCAVIDEACVRFMLAVPAKRLTLLGRHIPSPKLVS